MFLRISDHYPINIDRSPLLGVLLSLSFCGLIGCSEVLPPASMSFSKYAHLPENHHQNRGKVGFSTGAAVIGVETTNPDDLSNEDPDTEYAKSLWLFPVEGYASNWAYDRYDIFLSANSGGMLGLEGNAIIGETEKYRLGFVHGVGGGLAMSFGDRSSDGVVFYSAGAGLAGQYNTSPNGAVIFGAKYTYSSYAVTDDNDDVDSDDEATHFINGGLGFLVVSGALQVTPELLFTWGVTKDGSETDNMWIIMPSITLSAGY